MRRDNLMVCAQATTLTRGKDAQHKRVTREGRGAQTGSSVCLPAPFTITRAPRTLAASASPRHKARRTVAAAKDATIRGMSVAGNSTSHKLACTAAPISASSPSTPAAEPPLLHDAATITAASAWVARQEQEQEE